MSQSDPKSALELAMERLRKQDEAAGIVEKPLTDAQRQAIAEARNLCEARLAEIRILHESKLAMTFEPEARAQLEENYRRDAERITSDRDGKIQKTRDGQV
jgi:hypothetical protein